MVRILGRHKWVAGATITESIVDEDKNIRRFTATVRGWRNFKIYEGDNANMVVIINNVRAIRDRIDSGDETVFTKSFSPLCIEMDYANGKDYTAKVYVKKLFGKYYILKILRGN